MIIAQRAPLLPLPMSAAQRPPRRTSARFQEKEDAPPQASRVQITGNVKTNASNTSAAAVNQNAENSKKRKMSMY
jgi:hypothetical protein